MILEVEEGTCQTILNQPERIGLLVSSSLYAQIVTQALILKLIGVSSLLSMSAVLTLVYAGAVRKIFFVHVAPTSTTIFQRNFIQAIKRRKLYGTPLTPNPIDGYFVSCFVGNPQLYCGTQRKNRHLSLFPTCSWARVGWCLSAGWDSDKHIVARSVMRKVNELPAHRDAWLTNRIHLLLLWHLKLFSYDRCGTESRGTRRGNIHAVGGNHHLRDCLLRVET
jgi:hypothetical protein